MGNNKIVWALLDNRTGNRNQILGVLSKLHFEFKLIEIRYNFFSILPNFFFQIFYKNFHIRSLRNLKEGLYPDIILSCGRRTATVALELKKKFNFRPFCIHLMYPRFTLFKKNFDLIFIPYHDKVKRTNTIIKCLGSPSNVKLLKISNHKYEEPVIFLILGGNNKKYVFSADEVEKLIDKVVNNLSNRKGTVLITTSRRSSKALIEKVNMMKKDISIIKEVYHPNITKNRNPYIKYLSIANEIVVTGDSTSMISDACETGKPVRIYYNEKFCTKKHINFCESLIEKKYAFPIDTLGKKCNIIKKLNTSSIIADHIKRSFKNGKN